MIKFENTVTPSAEQWKATIMGARNALNSWDRYDSFLCTEGTMTNEEIEATCGKCMKKDCCDIYDEEPHFIIGPNDYDLMKRLRNAGTDHRKFMRMITVYVDVTAPLYWWKEADTYQVGVVKNSCSTMHKIHAKEFTIDDFSHEHLMSEPYEFSDGDDGFLDYLRDGEFEDTGLVLAVNDNGWLGQGYHTADGNRCIDYLSPEALLERYIITALNANREAYLRTKDKKYWWQMIQLLPSSYNQKRTVMLNYEVLANMYKSRKSHKLDEWREFCSWVETLPYSELITGKFEKEESK